MRKMSVLLTATLLVACGSSPQENTAAHQLAAFDVEPPPADEPEAATVAGLQIAYSYAVTYAFDQRVVGQVQGRQLALCRKLGARRCLVLRSTLNTPGSEDHIVTDEAVLMVDARLVGEMNRRLDALATADGAKLQQRQVEAEDVTRQVIDTEARVRAKQVLAERLLAIIRSGKGSVGDLVAAERAYATTQEELDAAREQRESLARRVAMSRITITYAFNDTPGAGSPIMSSFVTAKDTLAASIATLVTAAVASLPWLLTGGILLALLRRTGRKFGWRWPRRARSESTRSTATPM